MLKIYFGYSNLDFNPDSWFRSWFDRKYLLTDFTKRMLKSVAKCDMIGENLIISEILGPIDPERMGTGCKMVLFLAYEANKQRFGRPGIHWCGDNLIPFIREVGRMHDIVEFDCDRPIPLFDKKYGEYNDKVLLANTGKYCDNGWDFLDEFCAWEEGED